MERVDYKDNQLDDIAISDVSLFRLERLDANNVWIRLYRDNGSDFVIYLSSYKDIRGFHEQD